MERRRNYRVLVVIALLAICAANRERGLPTSAVERAEARATSILVTLYPELPKHLYYRGLLSLNAGDPVNARRLFESALEGRLYSNEGLLHNHALVLIELGAPQEEIEQARALWKKHFPHSKNPDPHEYQADRPSAR